MSHELGCAVVVLNWNGWQDTLTCVASLQLGARPFARIVVCDNGSTDDSLKQLNDGLAQQFGADFQSVRRVDLESKDWCPADRSVWLIANENNLGFAAGNNVGIRFALQEPACGHVWILNNDTEVAPDALAQALATMQQRPGMGLCGSTLVYHHDRHTVQAFGGSSYSRATGRTRHIGYLQALSRVPQDARAVEAKMACVVGAAMLASRPFLQTVGLMSEDYFLYFEEMDWAARARGRFALGYAPRSLVFHKEGASIGTSAQGGSPVSVYYLFRNRLRFAWRHHRAWVPLVGVSALLDVGRLAVRRRWPQAAAALRGLLQRRPPVPRPRAS